MRIPRLARELAKLQSMEVRLVVLVVSEEVKEMLQAVCKRLSFLVPGTYMPYIPMPMPYIPIPYIPIPIYLYPILYYTQHTLYTLPIYLYKQHAGASFQTAYRPLSCFVNNTAVGELGSMRESAQNP